jgi:hypothetical protein
MPDYTFTLDVRAGNLRFLPSRNGPRESGWNYTNLGSQAGVPSRQTTFVGAALEIDWVGTGIELFGEATPSSYNLSLTDTSSVHIPPNQSSLGASSLGRFSNLENTNHTLRFEVTDGTTQTNITYANLTTQLSSDGYAHHTDADAGH